MRMIIVRVIVCPASTPPKNLAAFTRKDIGVASADVLQIMPTAVEGVLLVERHEGPDLLVESTLDDLVAKLNGFARK